MYVIIVTSSMWAYLHSCVLMMKKSIRSFLQLSRRSLCKRASKTLGRVRSVLLFSASHCRHLGLRWWKTTEQNLCPQCTNTNKTTGLTVAVLPEGTVSVEHQWHRLQELKHTPTVKYHNYKCSEWTRHWKYNADLFVQHFALFLFAHEWV